MKIGNVLGTFLFSALMTFLAAGTLHWMRGWLFVGWESGCVLAMTAVSEYLNPGIAAARANLLHHDTKFFDRLFLALAAPLVLLMPTIAGADVHHWTAPLPTATLGLVMYTLSTAWVTWVLSVNPYAEMSVRVQTDRAQQVVTSGPYRIMRHPMYTGAIGMQLGAALILGSVVAFGMAGTIALLYLVRAEFEDLTLQRELDGYDLFTFRTPYKLVPGLW